MTSSEPVLDVTGEESTEAPISFLGSTSLISIATIASTALGLVKNKLFTQLFSTASLDPFFAAFQIPDFIFRIIITGAIASAFIPVMLEVREGKGNKTAIKFIQNTLNITVIALSCFSILFYFLLPILMPAIVPGFSTPMQETTVRLSRIMLFSPVLLGLSIVIRSTLNAYKKYLTIAITIAFYNIGIILGIILFTKFGMGEDALAWSVVLGAGLGLVVQFPAMYKLKIRPSTYINLHDKDIHTMAKLALPRFFGLAIIQFGFIIDTALASRFGTGSVSAIKFGLLVQDLPINFFAIPASVVAFPSLVEFVARKQFNKATEATIFALRQTMFFIMPIMVFMLFFANTIMEVLFGGKRLTPLEIATSANVLRLFTVSFIAQGFVYILVKAFFALKDTKTPVVLNTCAIIGKVLLALFAIWVVKTIYPLPDEIGVLILPFTFSLGQIVNAILLIIFLKKKIPIDSTLFSGFLIKMVVGCTAMAGSIILIAFLLPSTVPSWISMGIEGTIGGGVFLLVAFILKIEEFVTVLKGVQRRFLLTKKPKNSSS